MRAYRRFRYDAVNIVCGIRSVMARRPSTAKKPAPKPKRRMDASARAAQILAVASDMFAKDGIENTSMRRIAAKAGVTAPLLYKHYADKDELLMAIGEAFFAKLAARMEEEGRGLIDPVERMKARMRAYAMCGIENPRAYHLTFMTALPRLQRVRDMKNFRDRVRRGEAIPEDQITMGMRCFRGLEQSVADVIAAKRSRIKDVAILSEAVWAGGHGLVSLIITHSDFGFTDLKKLIPAHIDMMLNGLLKD